jgi:hypothetical protein
MLTPEELKQAREIARKAMPGPWLPEWRRGYRVTTESLDGDDETNTELIALVSGPEHNATHIATFNPAFVLRILDRVDAQTAENERLSSQLKIAVEALEYVMECMARDSTSQAWSIADLRTVVFRALSAIRKSGDV